MRKTINRQFTRVNFKIRVPEVRLIDAAGNMAGVVPTDKARIMARDQGLDLVEISPSAQPPVCRIMDYGKYRYEEQRKERVARKKQHSLALKEIKFHVTVEEHDYQTKLSSIRNFLIKGHKVKIALMFRGRENAHRELGFQVVSRIFKDCQDTGMVDMAPKLIGRGIFGVLAPRGSKAVPAAKPNYSVTGTPHASVVARTGGSPSVPVNAAVPAVSVQNNAAERVVANVSGGEGPEGRQGV